MGHARFLECLMGVNILPAGEVTETVGFIVAKLRQGMIQGGMDQADADKLLRDCVRIFMRELLTNDAFRSRGGTDDH